MIPERCEMPDINTVDSLESNLVLGLIAGYDTGLPKKFCLLRRVFVRLVIKAFTEYETARAMLVAQVAERNRPVEELARCRNIYMFSFTSHMETCVNATHRACRIFSELCSDATMPPIARKERRLIEKTADEIASLRNILEHIDGAIRKDEIGDKEPIMLRTTKDGRGVWIGSHTLTFECIANLLRRLSSIGEVVTRIDGRAVT